MIKKTFLSIHLVIIALGNLYSQTDFRSGFIITMEGDTLNGMIDYRSNIKNYQSCIYKDAFGSKEYFPDQLSGFGYIDDKYFTSQLIKGSFVEVLVIGDISIYKSEDKYHIKKDTSFFDLVSKKVRIEKDGKVGTKETSKWRGILTYLISDCLSNPGNHTSNIRLEEKSLAKLIVKYNKCRGSEFREYKASKPWTRFEFGASLGVSRSEISIDIDGSRAFSYLDDTYNSIDPSIGIIMEISSPRITERIAFQGELHIQKSNFSSLVALEPPVEEFHDTFIELTTLSIPISFKYSLPLRKYSLYFQGGFNYDYHLNSDTKLLSEQIRGNVVITFPERIAFEINNNQVGYWGGIGVLKEFKKFNGSVTARYFQFTNLNQTEGFSASNNRISLNLILFKK